MMVYHIECPVDQGFINAFIQTTTEHFKKLMEAPNHVGLDILQAQNNPRKMLVYLTFATTEAAEAYEKSGDYWDWTKCVAAWITGPIKASMYLVHNPSETVPT